MRRLREVTLLTYTTDINEYGERRKGAPTEEIIKMAIYPYSHVKTEDIRYQDVDLVGITKAEVNDSNMIKDGSVIYDVLFIQPTPRHNFVLMKVQK